MAKDGLMKQENALEKLHDNVHVKASRAVVWIEFTFGRLGVTNSQEPWLAQVGRGDLNGQSAVLLYSYKYARRCVRAWCGR